MSVLTALLSAAGDQIRGDIVSGRFRGTLGVLMKSGLTAMLGPAAPVYLPWMDLALWLGELGYRTYDKVKSDAVAATRYSVSINSSGVIVAENTVPQYLSQFPLSLPERDEISLVDFMLATPTTVRFQQTDPFDIRNSLGIYLPSGRSTAAHSASLVSASSFGLGSRSTSTRPSRMELDRAVNDVFFRLTNMVNIGGLAEYIGSIDVSYESRRFYASIDESLAERAFTDSATNYLRRKGWKWSRGLWEIVWRGSSRNDIMNVARNLVDVSLEIMGELPND